MRWRCLGGITLDGKHPHERLKTEPSKTSLLHDIKEETSGVQLFNLDLSVHQVTWYHMVLKSEFLGLAAYMSHSVECPEGQLHFECHICCHFNKQNTRRTSGQMFQSCHQTLTRTWSAGLDCGLLQHGTASEAKSLHNLNTAMLPLQCLWEDLLWFARWMQRAKEWAGVSHIQQATRQPCWPWHLWCRHVLLRKGSGVNLRVYLHGTIEKMW